MAFEITTGSITANGIDFSYLECGSGPLALCLHGFPDSAHSWRHLLPALAEAGFRAVAPFTRGYAPTSVAPDGLYQTGALSADANALHAALGGDSNAVIIGHDWGAPSVYGAAASEPDRWKRVVGMAVPPGPAIGAAFVNNLEQIKRSWYMFYFQHPLSDIVVPSNDLAYIDMLWRDWSPNHDGAVDAKYDAIQAAGGGELPQPALYLRGADDGCIGVEVAESMRTFSPWATLKIVEGAGHFLQLEKPAEVNKLIIDWVTAK